MFEASTGLEVALAKQNNKNINRSIMDIFHLAYI